MPLLLQSLSIQNVVLIDHLDLEFGAGLTAFTGETGAGKSIILDALGMAMGARSDKGLVRSGAQKAVATASFIPQKDHPVWAIVEGADIEVMSEDGLTLRRTIDKSGRSRAFANDTPISVGLLARIGQSLIEVHGQHDGQGLLDPSTHMKTLDQFGGYKRELDACRQAYQALQNAQQHYDTLNSQSEKAASELEFLDHAIAELDQLGPEKGEIETLTTRRKLLQNAEGALASLRGVGAILSESDVLEGQLGHAVGELDRLHQKIGEGASTEPLALAIKALETALAEIEEAKSSVNVAAEHFTIEPGDLERVDERFFALKAAARKYDTEVDGLAELRLRFIEERESVEALDHNIETAKRDLDAAQTTYDLAATALTKARKKAAEKLDKSVMKELPDLKMERAQFITQINEAPSGPLGRDQIRFAVATNPGTALGPLNRVASGGEMARFALAIKVALSARAPMTMVFDEVDQGVGGAVAQAVGRRLSRLSENGQVFVVTHSPQIAALADHQFRIEKQVVKDITRTQVASISQNGREEEIARMLAGDHISDEARAAARQLMGVK